MFDVNTRDVFEELEPAGFETLCVSSGVVLDGQLHGEAEVNEELVTELCNDCELNEVTEEQNEKLHNEILHEVAAGFLQGAMLDSPDCPCGIAVSMSRRVLPCLLTLELIIVLGVLRRRSDFSKLSFGSRDAGSLLVFVFVLTDFPTT